MKLEDNEKLEVINGLSFNRVQLKPVEENVHKFSPLKIGKIKWLRRSVVQKIFQFKDLVIPKELTDYSKELNIFNSIVVFVSKKSWYGAVEQNNTSWKNFQKDQFTSKREYYRFATVLYSPGCNVRKLSSQRFYKTFT